MDFQLSDFDKKVLSYCSRGISKNGAAEKIATYFSARDVDVNESLKRLKNHGLIIENTGTGVAVYTTSPLKVKSAMLDQNIIAQLAQKERGTGAKGFKKQTFNVETGEIGESKPKSKNKSSFDFDIV